MAEKGNTLSRTFVWIILALLIVGLAGFGATGLSGTIRTVGQVGDQPLPVNDYVRELQGEMRQFSARTGQALTMSQARELGIDQLVLSRLVTRAALDQEAADAGVSVGDEILQREILQIPGFQGLDGSFDRDSYRFALEQAGLNEAEFESGIRNDSARNLMQMAIVSGVDMPDTLTDTLIDYIGGRRSFTWAPVEESALSELPAAPDDAAIRAYYDDNIDAFMLPETRNITYAWLTPDMLLDDVDVSEDAIRTLYDERRGEYEQPERRLVDRLVFADEAAASSAKAQLEIGGTTFEALVSDRGLSLGDVDLGQVVRADLGGAADAVFAAEDGAVIGPLDSSLGPALFRINARFAEEITPFEDVAATLRDELAAERARRQIDAEVEPMEDLLAGGATLEELATETAMQQGELAWTADTDGGIAGYGAFNAAAASVTEDDFPEIAFLDDGGVFALRLNDVLPTRPEPFDAARPRVAEALRLSRLADAKEAQAETTLTALQAGEINDFAATALTLSMETDLTRTAFIEGAPAGLILAAFEMEPGEYRMVRDDDGAVAILRLDAVQPPDDGPDIQRLREAIGAQLDQDIAEALFSAFARDAQIRAGARIDQQALNAVLASFN